MTPEQIPIRFMLRCDCGSLADICEFQVYPEEKEVYIAFIPYRTLWARIKAVFNPKNSYLEEMVIDTDRLTELKEWIELVEQVSGVRE